MNRPTVIMLSISYISFRPCLYWSLDFIFQTLEILALLVDHHRSRILPNIILRMDYPWLNRHSSCTCTTIVYKLNAYAGAGSILRCGSMRLGCLFPVDWRWYDISPSLYFIIWIISLFKGVDTWALL